MTTQLALPSIAILVANGFDENHITLVQRAMTKEKLGYRSLRRSRDWSMGGRIMRGAYFYCR